MIIKLREIRENMEFLLKKQVQYLTILSLSTNFDDPDHSQGENRYIIIGLSNQGRYLFVSFVDRGEKIRLISARLVTSRERRFYEG